MDKKNKLLISYSGGRTSGFMTKWLLENKQDEFEMIVVFANTGKEREETLEFVKQSDEAFNFNCVWVEAVTNPERGKGVTAKVVTFETASRNGAPFESMIQKHGIPSVASPHCTRELKSYAIKAYARSIGWKGYYTAIGVRADEIDRVSPKHEQKKFIYPLVSMVPTTKNGINFFWSKQAFDLRLKTYEGNCDLCFKKAHRKLMTIVIETPETVIWWAEMERKYNELIPEGKKHNIKLIPPINFYRKNTSIKEIVKMSKENFEPAQDESQYIRKYNQLDLWGVNLDVGNGCTESCEVF
jgi:hypothetical protein